MRCSRCGNENPEQNRFCGMCGATLLAAPVSPAHSQPVSVSTSAAAAPELANTREPRIDPAKTTRVERPTDDRPAISGPSFLGLSDPSPSHSVPRKRARLSIDPHSAAGSNLEYLLSDEEQPRHWGPGKILLLLIALALAVGLGYLRFKTHGFAWLNPPAKKPDATVVQNPPSDNVQPSATSGITPDSQPVPAAPGSIQPAPESAPAAANPSSSTPPGSSIPAASAPSAAPETAKPIDATSSGTPENTATADTTPTKSPEPAVSAPSGKRSAKSAAPKPAPKPVLAKPSPASKPAVAADPVTEAQKYLYGKGVPQDCERGMRLLKPAANESNTKAMVEMGALYSAGLCTPHDLPTAYRWFALALRKDPENNNVQADLSKLWSEMTPPERQLAIKLSQ